MRSQRPETTAGAPGRAAPTLLGPAQLIGPALPPARRTRHLRSFLWWVGLAGIGAFLYWQQLPGGAPPPPARELPRPEREAFLALGFGRISETIPEALPAQTFREQLAALAKAGYSTISLEDLDAFYRLRRPLPERPVLLIFGEAQRETMEIADATLASLDMRGVCFVNLHAVAESNVDLVSRHRLKQLMRSGRWEAGVDSAAAEAREQVPATIFDAHRRDRELLESWLGSPVLAIAEQRLRLDDEAHEDAWNRGIRAAGYRLGLVLAPPRANYVDDSPFQIRSVRTTREWDGTEVAAQLAAREPRRGPFVDEFQAPGPSPAWALDHGELAIEDRALRISGKDGQSSGQVWLAGTERWRDASVTVNLGGPPKGQFWVALRTRGAGPGLRLGVAGGRAVLQQSADGVTHEIAAREIGHGPVELTLRMIGARAEAMLDGEPMLQRPAEVPAALTEGAVTLAVWSPQGEASARIRRIETKPLSAALALVSASPSEASWNELRRRADRLSIVSPRGALPADAEPHTRATLAVEIFAHYHHLHIFPALSVDRHPQPAEARRLVEQALQAVQSPDVDGLNLVIAPAVASTREGLDLVSTLRSRLREKRKPLIVTVLGRSVPHGLDDIADVFVADADHGSLEVAEAPLRLVKPGA